MESLWPKFEEQELEQNDSIQILRDQARAIKSETNGVVRATFSKMNYKAGPTSALKTLGQVVSAMSSPFYEEVLEEELADKTDVNALYLITKYKFELYNDEYRFRLFVLNHREMFPISLEVDEGICEDIQYKNGSPISGNDELKTVLREIFSSYKVHSVVSKMLQKVEQGN
jgi:hypothetical protein